MKQRQLRNEPFAVTGKWEFRITTCSPSSICTIFNCATGKRGFDHKVPPFHLLYVESTHRNWSFSTPPFPLPHGQCCAYCRNWKLVTGPPEKFHGAVWEIHNGSCAGTPLHDFSGTQHRVPVWNATKAKCGKEFHVSHLCTLQSKYLDRLHVLRKGPRLPRLTVDCWVPTIIKDHDCSSLLNGKRPAKRRESKIWLIIAHSLDNFIRSQLPAWKGDMAVKETGKRRKKWRKLRTVLYNSANALTLISTVRVWQNRSLNSNMHKTY